jgi:hypothetical protein
VKKNGIEVLEIRSRFNRYNDIVNSQPEVDSMSKSDMIDALAELRAMVAVQEKIVDGLDY